MEGIGPRKLLAWVFLAGLLFVVIPWCEWPTWKGQALLPHGVQKLLEGIGEALVVARYLRSSSTRP